MEYSAFLSYSHKDEKIAKWLMRKLEAYRVPKNLVGTPGSHGAIPTQLRKVFRDRDELPSAGDLSQTIKIALSSSQALIVICSPASAQSLWVNAEVASFREHHGSSTIFCFVVDGDPSSREPDIGCFPPEVLKPDNDGEPEREPLAADARKQGDGRNRAFTKLVAGLLGVGYDSLVQRETQKRHRRMAMVTSFSLAGMVLTSVLAVSAYLARNDAERRQFQAEELVGFMLGELRGNLVEVGRLALMRSVDDKATEYFGNLNPRDMSDRSLEDQARSLTGIGEVRLSEGNHDEATKAFAEAHSRASALFERDPDNGPRLFDLAQAEFWIGYVALQQGRLDDAGDWLRKYRDSAIHLSSMDPDNFDWQREVAYGHTNLAVLDENLGHFDSAEQSMLALRDLYIQWLVTRQDDYELRFEYANVISWLGSLAFQQGRLTDASAYFSEQRQTLSQNVTEDPENVRWRRDLLVSLLLLVDVHYKTGQYDEALLDKDTALELARRLVQQDSENNRWRWSLGIASYWHAGLSGQGQSVLAAESESIMRRVNEIEPEDEDKARWYAKTMILSGRIGLAENDHALAANKARQAQILIEPYWLAEPNEQLRVSMAEALILEGEVLLAESHNNNAENVLNQALKLLLLQDEQAADLPFARLVSLSRVMQLLEHEDRAQYQQFLLASGFVETSLPL